MVLMMSATRQPLSRTANYYMSASPVLEATKESVSSLRRKIEPPTTKALCVKSPCRGDLSIHAGTALRRGIGVVVWCVTGSLRCLAR